MSATALFAAAAAAVVELDAASVGQVMVSRPIVLGPALGAGLGDASLGAGLGVLCELFSLGDAPVGGRVSLNATVAVSCALLLALGPASVPVEAAFPAGLVAGVLHARLESVLRGRRAATCAAIGGRLVADKPPRLFRFALSSLSVQAAATFAVLAAALALAPLIGAGFSASPACVQSGLRIGLGFAPLLALASLIHSFKVVS